MSDSEKAKRGQALLQKLSGGAPKSETFNIIEEVFPDYMKMTEEWIFGDIWSRPRLTLRERTIATLAALQATVCVDELKTYMRYAHNTGMSVQDIMEIVMHVANYSGWPSGVNGMIALTETFPTRED